MSKPKRNGQVTQHSTTPWVQHELEGQANAKIASELGKPPVEPEISETGGLLSLPLWIV